MNKNNNINKTNDAQIQQGDVLLNRVAQLPADCQRRNNRTIALGEHTGHHHTFDEGVAVMDDPNGKVYVVNETDHPVNLTHQEHKPVVAAPGEVYLFGIVREYDYFSKMQRSVRD